ncbi:hypothetical protein E2C01_022754 [Portunus trituberculatus]|uniref:Uncharacterized protein n=1 Tax=Portunus trituberculatus TaxID=210409 RepID=A0A5B7E849_PORTR|nr:hypothetical protein [Portunus trituberculatus]
MMHTGAHVLILSSRATEDENVGSRGQDHRCTVQPVTCSITAHFPTKNLSTLAGNVLLPAALTIMLTNVGQPTTREGSVGAWSARCLSGLLHSLSHLTCGTGYVQHPKRHNQTNYDPTDMFGNTHTSNQCDVIPAHCSQTYNLTYTQIPPPPSKSPQQGKHLPTGWESNSECSAMLASDRSNFNPMSCEPGILTNTLCSRLHTPTAN